MFPLGTWVKLINTNIENKKDYHDRVNLLFFCCLYVTFTYWKVRFQSPPSWQFPAYWKQSICIYPWTGQSACCETWMSHFCCLFWLLGCLEGLAPGHPLSMCICWSKICTQILSVCFNQDFSDLSNLCTLLLLTLVVGYPWLHIL